jgi:Domain of unknown function (DUF397)
VVNLERASILWRKSSFSGGGDCVEVASIAESVALRDSHAPWGPVLSFTPNEWTVFLGGVRSGTPISAGRPASAK